MFYSHCSSKYVIQEQLAFLKFIGKEETDVSFSAFFSFLQQIPCSAVFSKACVSSRLNKTDHLDRRTTGPFQRGLAPSKLPFF